MVTGQLVLRGFQGDPVGTPPLSEIPQLSVLTFLLLLELTSRVDLCGLGADV